MAKMAHGMAKRRPSSCCCQIPRLAGFYRVRVGLRNGNTGGETDVTATIDTNNDNTPETTVTLPKMVWSALSDNDPAQEIGTCRPRAGPPLQLGAAIADAPPALPCLQLL